MTGLQRALRQAAAALATGLLGSIPAHAFELEFLDGELTVDVRSQFNYGISTSVEKVDKDYLWGLPPSHVTTNDADIATGHGGTGSGLISQDDGRLTHKRGVYQNQFKGITDIRASYGDFGAIVKVLYFYDQAVMNKGSRARSITEPHVAFTGMDGGPGGPALVNTGQRATREVKYNSKAIEQIGKDITTKEMYAYYDGYISDWWETGTFLDDIALNVRIGDQIIRWGQSTFAPGISVFNPLDANRVLTPGFDLAELAGPVGGLFISAAVTDWLTVETWAGYDFQPLQLPPGGSFFTYYDPAGAGVDDYSGQGQGFCVPFSQHESRWDLPNGHPSGLGGACLPLQSPQFAKDRGQFGLKLGFALPFEMFNTFEVYTTRFHNTFPVVQVTQTGVVPNSVPCEVVDDLLIAAGDTEGVAFGNAIKALNTANGSFDPDDETEEAGCRTALPYSLTDQPTPGGLTPGGFTNLTDEFLKAGLAWIEGLDGYGFAWTGNLPFGGIAWSGEFSYRPDTPMQVAVGEVFSAVAYVHANSEGINQTVGAFTVPSTLTGREVDDLTNGFLYITRNIHCFDWGLPCAPAQAVNGKIDDNNDPSADGSAGTGQDREGGAFDAATCGTGDRCDGTIALGVNPAGTPAQGWWPLDLYQLNFSFTKIFSNMLWQDNIIFLTEFVGAYIDGLDDLAFGFDIPNYRLVQPLNEGSADDWGWGYRMLLLAQRPALMGTKIDLTTTLIWFHDVKNTTPTNLNLFVEDRMQGILQFDFKYGTFLTTFRYLYFGGAKGNNPFIDRDTFQVNFRYTI